MNWESAVKLPWGVLLLFGGGLSLAGVIRSTGLAEWIAQSLGALGSLPVLAMIGVVVVIIFLTEVTSNTATAAAFLPLLCALAVAQGMPPAAGDSRRHRRPTPSSSALGTCASSR